MGFLSGIAAIGGIIAGNQVRQGNQANANAVQQALAEFNNIQSPSIADQELLLQTLASAGDYHPEDLKAMVMSPSLVAQVQANPELMDTQMGALNQYKDIANNGGLTESDQAASRELHRKVSGDDMARRQAILSQMAQRGMLGSGGELAAQLSSAQDSTETQAGANDKLIQQALERKMGALNNMASMSTNMRTQDFSEKNSRAEAADAINKFNTQNSQNVYNQNVGNRNTANLRNLDNTQDIANKNVGIKNTQQANNKSLLQKQYDNQVLMARLKANQHEEIGKVAAANGQSNADAIAGVTSGVADLYGNFASKK